MGYYRYLYTCSRTGLKFYRHTGTGHIKSLYEGTMVHCEYKELSLKKQIENSNEMSAYYADQIYKDSSHGVYLGFECNNGLVTTLAFDVERR